jgi:hypothetical protein
MILIYNVAKKTQQVAFFFKVRGSVAVVTDDRDLRELYPVDVHGNYRKGKVGALHPFEN